jgi:hypothetical protein
MTRLARILLYLFLGYVAFVGLQLVIGSVTILGVVIGFVVLFAVALAVVALRRRPPAAD